MGRTALVILRWIVLLGGILYAGANEGRDLVVSFLRDVNSDAPTSDWRPWDFVIKQIFYLFLTAGSGLAAVHFRLRIEAIDAVRDS